MRIVLLGHSGSYNRGCEAILRCTMDILRRHLSPVEFDIISYFPDTDREPLSSYLAKGGSREETIGKQCLCNGLLATIGLGQTREDGAELAIVTSGDDFSPVVHLVTRLSADYRASDVLDYLTS